MQMELADPRLQEKVMILYLRRSDIERASIRPFLYLSSHHINLFLPPFPSMADIVAHLIPLVDLHCP
jgi:hypothetical protein